MQRVFKVTLLFSFLALFGQGAWAEDSYSKTIQAFKDAGDSAGYFNSAYGYAVFPTIGKGGIGIGGAHGRGRVYTGGRHVGDTSMTQVVRLSARSSSSRTSAHSANSLPAILNSAPRRPPWLLLPVFQLKLTPVAGLLQEPVAARTMPLPPTADTVREWRYLLSPRAG